MPITELVLIGFVAGMVGGMLGVGGSIVMIPAMIEVLGPDQHLYQSAAMIVNLFVVLPAVAHHRRARAIDARVVARLVPMALVAVVLGVALSELPLFAGAGEAKLRGLFGLFLLFVAGYELYRLWRGNKEKRPASLSASPESQASHSSHGEPEAHVHVRSGTRAEKATHGNSSDFDSSRAKTTSSRANIAHQAGSTRASAGWWRTAAVAIPTGLVAGLLGVGGGVLAVPLQRRLLGIDIRGAIANSATIIIATSIVGASVKNYAYAAETGSVAQPFILAAILAPTAVVGSMLGSRLTHRLPLRLVKIAFFILLVAAAVRLTTGAITASKDAPATPTAQIVRDGSTRGVPA